MPSSRPTRSKQRSKELPDNSKSKFTLQSFVRAFPSAPELTYFQPGLLGEQLPYPLCRECSFLQAQERTFNPRRRHVSRQVWNRCFVLPQIARLDRAKRSPCEHPSR